jgi:hypothetical protein
MCPPRVVYLCGDSKFEDLGKANGIGLEDHRWPGRFSVSSCLASIKAEQFRRKLGGLTRGQLTPS